MLHALFSPITPFFSTGDSLSEAPSVTPENDSTQTRSSLQPCFALPAGLLTRQHRELRHPVTWSDSAYPGAVANHP